MAEPVQFPQNILPRIEPSRAAQAQVIRDQARAAAKQAFENILQSTLQQGDALRFSAHAKDRLVSRGIHLQSADLQKIQQAVERAAAKGAKQALLIKENLALIVSVTNRTVITALDGAHMRENVFTNIDSAVFVE